MKHKYLFLNASVIGLSAMIAPQAVMAQTCNGVQNRSTQCVTSAGAVVSDSYCTSNGLSRPETSQDCAYSCPPPPPPSSGDGDGSVNHYYHYGEKFTVITYASGESTTSPGWQSYTVGDGNYKYGQGSSGGDGDGDGGDGDGDSVLCTYFHRLGELSDNDYYVGFIHGMQQAHPATWRGYHAWAVPYVRYLYNNPGSVLEALIRPVVMHRSAEISYQMGVRDKPDYVGKLVRLVLDNFSFALGAVVKDTDCTSLYSREDLKLFAQHFKAYKNRNITVHAQSDPTAIILEIFRRKKDGV